MLSGDVPQKQRLRILHEFSDGKLPLLIATDVAARGLHIPDVSHVFNFDLPQDAEDYVHRIGRTARAGKSGDAVSFACERYVFSLPEIEAYVGHKIPVAAIDPEMLAKLEAPARIERSRERRGRDRDRSSRPPRRGERQAERRERPPRERPPRERPTQETAGSPPAPPAERKEPPRPRKSAQGPQDKPRRRYRGDTPAIG